MQITCSGVPNSDMMWEIYDEPPEGSTQMLYTLYNSNYFQSTKKTYKCGIRSKVL